ncbi:hypothetical protein N0V86_004565 [Didymella sp. IMI 355093]|nr:hypothetical protein N0V86_004565 [Didymella sp. IMI 355093]
MTLEVDHHKKLTNTYIDPEDDELMDTTIDNTPMAAYMGILEAAYVHEDDELEAAALLRLNNRLVQYVDADNLCHSLKRAYSLVKIS